MLEPRALRLEPDLGEALRDIGPRLGAARRADAAAFHVVGRQDADVLQGLGAGRRGAGRGGEGD
ncbi:hypothetical protein, partial [Caulobacter sp. B11]|uniref:hypothetical protein n=1 Tax=Caulobacter sp. B11 TaxID=2048899 RepID=UPI001F3C3481